MHLIVFISFLWVIHISNHMYRTLGKCVPLEMVDFLCCTCCFFRWCIAFSFWHSNIKANISICFSIVTLFLIEDLTLVKHEGTCVFLNLTLLMSHYLDLSSVKTGKNATTSGIFSIWVGYCGLNMLKYARPRSLCGTANQASEVCFRSKTEGGHISPYSVYNFFITYYIFHHRIYIL